MGVTKNKMAESSPEPSLSETLAKLAADMVRIPNRAYSMCRYPVTQALWKAVMGDNPSVLKGADLPVVNVSWNDCQVFLNRLNALPEVLESGLAYRLPNADEWMHACLAGATGGFCKSSSGVEISPETLGDVAWFRDNADGPRPVGEKEPNAFGLYDMLGNIAEWSVKGDWGITCCGHDWDVDAEYCNAYYTCRYRPDTSGPYLGFRLVRDLPFPDAERVKMAKLADADRRKIEEFRTVSLREARNEAARRLRVEARQMLAEAKQILAGAMESTKSGNDYNALALCRTAERLAPDDPEVLFLLGMIHYEIGDFISVWDYNDTLAADKYFDKVLSHDPKCVKAHLFKGLGTLRWGNNYSLALKSFQKVLKLEPDNQLAAQLAEICRKCKKRKVDEAQEELYALLHSIGADYSIDLRWNQFMAEMSFSDE